MKRLLSTLKVKWPEYLLEGTVIVASILLAIWLENWNEDRLERKEEKEILQRVKNDLENTIKELAFLNEIRNRILTGTKGIMETLGKEKINKDSLDGFLGLTMYRPTFNNKLGTVDLLFTSGKINLIKNDELKDRLIAWPGSIDDTIEEEKYAMKLMQDHYYPKMAEYINIQDLMRFTSGPSFVGAELEDEVLYPINGFESDLKGLISDKEFINHLRMRASHLHICNGEVAELIRQTKEIISLIDQEISQ